jgi:hypothetical protein
MPYQQVTLLKDLPDIDTMEQETPNTSKYIRKTDNIMPPESGMSLYAQPMGSKYNQAVDMDDRLGRTYRPEYMETYTPQQPSCNCHDLYNHYSECFICQKFYKSDCTVYLVIIAILMLACALLSKKVLNI